MRPLRHGYTNDTRSDGAVVVKRYAGPSRRERRETELAALTTLAGLLPVPAVLATEPDTLIMEHVAGVHGQELVDAGHAAAVLRSCGEMLRRLQAVDTRDGSVLVHGDYGPNNMLFDPETFAVTAVLDWEWASRGDRVSDLAWCEWIIRTHHPGEVGALGALFDGYGERPPLSERRAAAVARCAELRDMTRTGDGPHPAVLVWQRRLDATLGWTE